MVLIGILVGIGSAVFARVVPWLPERASEEATAIDRVFWFTTFICLAIFALVAAVSVYTAVKFRAGPDDPEDGRPIHGHTGLEIVWRAVPAILVTAIAVVSAVALGRNDDGGARPMRVEVIAQQFAWSFKYPNGVISPTLRLPVDRDVVLRLTAKDVIHSFWVPEFRMKQDAVPGVETRTVITPTKVGTYDVICTELCGLGHATMRARARVLSAEDYEAWRTEEQGSGETGGGGGGDGEGEASGEAVFNEAGCAGCHALEAAGSTAEVGPELDTFLADADEDAIRRAIVAPNEDIAEGYQPNVMPQDYEQRLSDEDLDALVQYLGSAAEG